MGGTRVGVGVLGGVRASKGVEALKKIEASFLPAFDFLAGP